VHLRNTIAIAYDGTIDDYSNDIDVDAVAGIVPIEDIPKGTIAEPDDTLAVQNAILDEMRRIRFVPNDLQFDNHSSFAEDRQTVWAPTPISMGGARLARSEPTR